MKLNPLNSSQNSIEYRRNSMMKMLRGIRSAALADSAALQTCLEHKNVRAIEPAHTAKDQIIDRHPGRKARVLTR